MLEMIKQFVRDEEGAVAIEYALLAALIALAIIVGAGALGTELSNFFQAIADWLEAKEPTVPAA